MEVVKELIDECVGARDAQIEAAALFFKARAADVAHFDEGGHKVAEVAGCNKGGEGGETAKPYFRKSLRNTNINYRSGWWSVSIQVAKNKSIFGAIFGDKAVLNALGRAVGDYWRALPAKYPELELFDYVVMPNHFHALLRVHFKPTNREHHLGFLMSRFKGGTSYIYGKMRRAGEVENIGDRLWQRDYWDDLVTSDEEFAGWQKYIRENPANWSSDRYGACTAFSLGDTELLNRPRVAFVASQGFFASELRPRKIWQKPGLPGHGDEADGETSKSSASADRVLISTFTSAQEREALRRALAKKRALVAVFPAGIPAECNMDPALIAAIRAGWALAVSPQAPGSRLNKKIATWCNEFLLKNADEIWVGDLSPNGMLAQMLAGVRAAKAARFDGEWREARGAARFDGEGRGARGAARFDEDGREARGAARFDGEGRGARGAARFDEEGRGARGDARFDEEGRGARGAARFDEDGRAGGDEDGREGRGAARFDEDGRGARGAARFDEEGRGARGAARFDGEGRGARGAARFDEEGGR